MAKTILAVANSEHLRHLISFGLKEAGYEVIAPLTAGEAMAKLSDTKAEMAIIDLNMPGMEGVELIRQIRNAPKYKFIPIIMLISESDALRKQEGKKAGVSGWIVRPFTVEQLTDVVRRFLR